MTEPAPQEQMQLLDAAAATVNQLVHYVTDELGRGRSRDEILRALTNEIIGELIPVHYAKTILTAAVWEMGRAIHEGDWG